ncbi:MAG TPA: xanthine dehydrogenase molybdopterin binding subunit [Burkholderiaceae bacterium]|nr:xanthine dehydrogenase molybdopterin binding subunit [Burkholderiaceae bacterium]
MNAPETLIRATPAAEVQGAGLVPAACGSPLPHESARAQVAGRALYIDDLPEWQGTLYAAPVTSPVAHGRLKGLDAAAALAMPGVAGIVTAEDIPGDKRFAVTAHDEAILPVDEVEYLGQVVALVVADSPQKARAAARAVRCEVEPLPAILTIEEALQAHSYVLPPVVVRRGEPDVALHEAPQRLRGEFCVGGQEHFYLEGQIAYAVPEEDGWHILSSTQHPGEVQHWVAHALGVDNHQVRVECRRMGGGFGGKETQAGHLAVWAALAARKLGRPVKLRLERLDDMLITGKRHNFLYRYEVGFERDGRIRALKLMLASQCGFSADLSGPVNDRAVFHVDNAYFLEHVEVTSYRCKTHTQSNTAFRGFGGPQGMIAIEAILGDIARHLGLDPLTVRQRNFYGTTERNQTHYGMTVEDNVAPELVARLAADARYAERRRRIDAWNAGQPVLKRGLALTPVKFGISFTATFFNQAGALVHVYGDGTVQVNHGGTEMGQGLHTKVCQIVADELGVPFERVRITASDTSKVPNASATAASSGTDLNGRAAQFAARQIRQRLVEFVAREQQVDAASVVFASGKVITPKATRDFADVVHAAYVARVQLWSDGFYATPKIHYDKHTLSGRPFYYFAYGAALTEVVIDTLTGENKVVGVDILHDVGRSINPALDIGQIEGGFIQGMGWLTTEELVWNREGRLLTHAPSTYKIPATGDVPPHFEVRLWPEPNREDNVFGSKAVGEPPFMLAISVYEALRDAIAAVRPQDRRPVVLHAPATPESVLRAVRSRLE